MFSTASLPESGKIDVLLITGTATLPAADLEAHEVVAGFNQILTTGGFLASEQTNQLAEVFHAEGFCSYHSLEEFYVLVGV